MSNPFYNHDERFPEGSLGRGAVVDEEFEKVEAAFDGVKSNLDAKITAEDGLTENLNFNTFKGTNAGDPTAAQDVSTKAYTDTQRDTRVAKAGLDANLPAGGFKITGHATPTAGADVAIKSYVDTQRDTRVAKSGLDANLPAGGFKITGHGTPTAGGDVTTKNYVDVQRDTRIAKTGLDANLPAAGFKITGHADPTDPQDVATRAYVLASVGAGGDPGDIPITSLGTGALAARGLLTGGPTNPTALSPAVARYRYGG